MFGVTDHMIPRRFSRFSATAGLLLLSALPASAQIIFQMDYSAGAFPAGGWDDPQPEEGLWVRRRIDGAGPSGQPVIELRQVPCMSCRDHGGQFNWGWRGNIEANDPAYGSRRYYRFRVRWSTDSNFRSAHLDTGELGNHTNKQLIVGQGCSTGSCRFILNTAGDIGSRRVNFFMAKDGGEDQVETDYVYPVGQWLHVQVELQASSSRGAANGGYKLWINNNDYSRPTIQRTNIVLDAANWRYVWFGAFNNAGLQSNGVNTWQQTDFQVATTFASNWASGQSGSSPPPSTPAPAPPRNVRIVP
jgi:hypothetical protein